VRTDWNSFLRTSWEAAAPPTAKSKYRISATMVKAVDVRVVEAETMIKAMPAHAFNNTT
jgi:hypothetical protein